MTQIKLRILGLPKTQSLTEEENINVESIEDILRHIESRYPKDYYSFTVLLNGIGINESSTSLSDGDEVVVIPAMSGG